MFHKAAGLALLSAFIAFVIVATGKQPRPSGESDKGGARAVSGGALAASPASRSAARDDARYPYYSSWFREFVAESYRYGKAGDAGQFYAWMEKAYASAPCRFPRRESLGLEELLAVQRDELAAIADRGERARAAMEQGAWLHKLVKTIIPRFSLDRGFEFFSVVRRAERQCFLQSVLIAGLLQQMGVDAGVAMVSRNTRGEETNNGHAVTLVRLADGHDLIVDASDPEPFARQQGLLVRCPEERYLKPVYEKGSDRIIYYEPVAGRERIAPEQVRPLDRAFIRSQFWYYRGERAAGGLLAARKTRAGLDAAARALTSSVQVCPRNALAVYMLGRVRLAQGDARRARALFEQSHRLYAGCGWVPAGARQALAWTARSHSE